MASSRRSSLQPASPTTESVQADHHLHRRHVDGALPLHEDVDTPLMVGSAPDGTGPLRRMSLPSLVGGLGKASVGLHNWHSKVLAKKVARSSKREEAHRIAQSASIITVDTTTRAPPSSTGSSPAASPISSPTGYHDPYNFDSDGSEDSETPDLRDQGNLEFYNDDNLLRREHLRYHASIIKTIDGWWHDLVLPLFDLDGDGNIQKKYEGFLESPYNFIK